MRLTGVQLAEILAKLIAVGGPFDPADVWVGVAAGIADNGQATAIGDLSVVTGDLADRVPIVAWGPAYVLADGRHVVDGPLCAFRPGDGEGPFTVRVAYYADDLTAGALLGWQPILPGVTLEGDEQQFSFIPRLVVDPSGRWSASIHFDGNGA